MVFAVILHPSLIRILFPVHCSTLLQCNEVSILLSIDCKAIETSYIYRTRGAFFSAPITYTRFRDSSISLSSSRGKMFCLGLHGKTAAESLHCTY